MDYYSNIIRPGFGDDRPVIKPKPPGTEIVGPKPPGSVSKPDLADLDREIKLKTDVTIDIHSRLRFRFDNGVLFLDYTNFILKEVKKYRFITKFTVKEIIDLLDPKLESAENLATKEYVDRLLEDFNQRSAPDSWLKQRIYFEGEDRKFFNSQEYRALVKAPISDPKPKPKPLPPNSGVNPGVNPGLLARRQIDHQTINKIQSRIGNANKKSVFEKYSGLILLGTGLSIAGFGYWYYKDTINQKVKGVVEKYDPRSGLDSKDQDQDQDQDLNNPDPRDEEIEEMKALQKEMEEDLKKIKSDQEPEPEVPEPEPEVPETEVTNNFNINTQTEPEPSPEEQPEELPGF